MDLVGEKTGVRADQKEFEAAAGDEAAEGVEITVHGAVERAHLAG